MTEIIENVVDVIDRKSTLGDATSYFLKHSQRLALFLRRGEVEIDNNAVERAIRRIAIIRKASLHASSEGGAHAWMIFSSLVATCEANRVDPRRYFHWLFYSFEKWRADETLPLEARVAGIMPWDFEKLDTSKGSEHQKLMARVLL